MADLEDGGKEEKEGADVQSCWCCESFTARYDEGYIRLERTAAADPTTTTHHPVFYIHLAKNVRTNVFGTVVSHSIGRFPIRICPFCGKTL